MCYSLKMENYNKYLPSKTTVLKLSHISHKYD